MDTKKDVLEFGKSKLNQWKGMIEELELQISLGKAEAKDTFKVEKKNITKFFNQQKTEFKKADAKTEKQRISLVQKLTELNASLLVAVPDSKRPFENWRKKIMQLVHETENLARMMYKDAGERATRQLDELKEGLDNYRIQLALGKFETKGKINASQNALIEALEKTIALFDEKKEENGKSIENFMEEISHSFDHLKNAFSEILN
ncbi:MAG: hypothetical protein ACI8P3_000982 [Saprospiraceae bacterium]|jgi:uncharacterized protein (DUF1501 family)